MLLMVKERIVLCPNLLTDTKGLALDFNVKGFVSKLLKAMRKTNKAQLHREKDRETERDHYFDVVINSAETPTLHK